MIAINGKIGSGKSLFARSILLQVSQYEKEILAPVLEAKPYLRLEFLVVNNDANKSMMLLGPWRGFIQHLLELVSLDRHCTKEQVVQGQIQNTSAMNNKITCIEEIFGIEHVNKKQHSVKMHEQSTKF